MDHVFKKNDFTISLDEQAAKNTISTRTLQRYFEMCTGTATKEALQLMRIRKAITDLIYSPENFEFNRYGYYDNSHFQKHINQFLEKTTITDFKPSRKVLELLHKNV